MFYKIDGSTFSVTFSLSTAQFIVLFIEILTVAMHSAAILIQFQDFQMDAQEHHNLQ